MTTTLRKRSVDTENSPIPAGSRAKRPRTETSSIPTTTTTFQVYQALQSKYSALRDSDQFVSLDQFIGLCAYLCTVLSWGYRFDVRYMDAFVVSYLAFRQHLLHLEHQRLTAPEVRLPAYHQWFDENRGDLKMEDTPIMDERKLRLIWRENPFVFLRAQHSLRAIAGLARTARELKQSHRT